MPVNGITSPDTLSQFRSTNMGFILPLAALLAAAAPAVADDVVTVRIAHGDVDVSTTEGRAALEARIDTQLRKACALPGTARFVHGRDAVDGKCVADARAVALAEVERLASRGTRSAGAVAAN